MEKDRVVFLDNAKAVLIALVVLGHMLEQVQFPGKSLLYIGIYAFHMPAFAFISGICFKKGTNWVRKLLLPYFIFQTAYVYFFAWISGTEPELQYSTPYWLLWYQLSMACWYALASSLDPIGRKGFAVLIASVCAALLCGYDWTIGYYFALSRTIVFFPFFWAGVCARANFHGSAQQAPASRDKYVLYLKWAVAAVAMAGLAVLCIYRNQIPFNWFYNSRGYDDAGYTMAVRAGILALGAVFTTLFLMLIPTRTLPVITSIGRHTLPVYLIHGLLVRYMGQQGWLDVPPIYALPLVLALTAILVLALSSKPVVLLFRLPSILLGRAEQVLLGSMTKV